MILSSASSLKSVRPLTAELDGGAGVDEQREGMLGFRLLQKLAKGDSLVVGVVFSGAGVVVFKTFVTGVDLV
jgi:hypothetical protein